MAPSASIARSPGRQIAKRTRGHSHRPITRLMGPSDFGQLLKPGRGVQMHQFGAALVERSLAGDDLAGQLGTLAG